MSKWISVNDELPESKDENVLVHFENGSIETCHIQFFFDDITAGLDGDGAQLYSKYLTPHKRQVTKPACDE